MSNSEKTELKLSVLMPTYNERSTIDDILDRVLAAPLPQGMTLEVIVVDDGSTDGSWELLSRRAETESRIHAVRHDKNHGKGAALVTAISKASGDLAIMQDADLEYDPKDYGKLLAPLLEDEADVVYGSRFASPMFRRVMPFRHHFENKVVTVFTNALANLNLTDARSSARAFWMNVLKTIPIRSSGFGSCSELTAKIAKRRLRLFETAVSYNGRTHLDGKKSTMWDTVRSLGVMVKYYFIDDLYEESYGKSILLNMELTTHFTRWVIRRIRPWLSGVILEVGAGIGNNVRALLDQEKIIATEPEPEYVELLNNTFSGRRRVSVMQWDATEPAPEGLSQVDTILCSNVLEHIERDGEALRNMHKTLVADGRLVLIVPAGARLHGSLDVALGHFRRYDKKTLSKQLMDIGFDMEACFSMNKVGVLGWFVNGLILRRKNLGRFQLKVFDLLVPIISLVDPILPWTGLSLVAVARKNSVEPDGSS